MQHLILKSVGARLGVREARQGLEGGSSLLVTYDVQGGRWSLSAALPTLRNKQMRQPVHNAMKTPGRPPAGLPHCLKSPHLTCASLGRHFLLGLFRLDSSAPGGEFMFFRSDQVFQKQEDLRGPGLQ